MTGLAPVFDEGIKHHENSNIADAHRGRRHHAFAITAHVAFLNLQVTGLVFILTGVAGAIIPRRGWLCRILAVKGRPGAAAAGGTGQPPPPSRRPVPGAQPAAAPMPCRPSTRPSRNTLGA